MSKIAEQIARKRGSVKGGTLRIEAADVREAANLVLNALKALKESGEITEDLTHYRASGPPRLHTPAGR